MERGLLWLPLLGIFGWLAWAGWNEYRKVEAYKLWAVSFERAKYDLYAALGQQRNELVWGTPTRKGIVEEQRVALETVSSIELWADERSLPTTASLPKGCRIALALHTRSGSTLWIPFTEVDLANTWANQLQAQPDSLQSSPQP
jgi:hypothetical protein